MKRVEVEGEEKEEEVEEAEKAQNERSRLAMARFAGHLGLTSDTIPDGSKGLPIFSCIPSYH